ncbi:MAG: conjugal transfer protein TraF [Burkholderiales bacterium]|nr:conjugal transfer protein TraF [Burkholderiales bacterium]
MKNFKSLNKEQKITPSSNIKQIITAIVASTAVIALSGIAFETAMAENFWEEDVWTLDDRGFLYYPSEKENQKFISPDLKSLPSVLALSAERTRRLELAIMEPTPENIRSYLEANYFVQEKSALFADQWRRVLWQNPEFDFTTRNPAANFAQVQMKSDKKEQDAAALNFLSQDWGLVYFYRNDCQFCQLQSPLVRKLSDELGFEVIAISMDGISSDLFPESLPDNGIGSLLTNGAGVNQVPALFMVNRDQTESYLVSSGVVALDDILNRIVLLATKDPGDSLFGGNELKDTAMGFDASKLLEKEPTLPISPFQNLGIEKLP